MKVVSINGYDCTGATSSKVSVLVQQTDEKESCVDMIVCVGDVEGYLQYLADEADEADEDDEDEEDDDGGDEVPAMSPSQGAMMTDARRRSTIVPGLGMIEVFDDVPPRPAGGGADGAEEVRLVSRSVLPCPHS